MHDHDLDLIASLADGSLDDQTEARALVEACQECRQEYETQSSVLTALATLEAPKLTDLEKAALHRDLWTELRREPATKASATPWWYRWSYAAAGLFVLVGLVAVVGQLGIIGGVEMAETFSEVSSGLDQGSAEALEEPMSPMGDDGGSAVTTTAQATDTSATTTTATTADFENLAVETRQNQLPEANRVVGENAEEDQCLIAAGLVAHKLVGTVELDKTYLIAVPSPVDLNADTPVNFVDAASCEVVHVEE